MKHTAEKNNIIIRGLRETENESNDQCEHMVRLFLVNNLKIKEEDVKAIQFVRCHRLRGSKQTTVRDIIVRFRSLSDRELIWSKKHELSGNRQFGINEVFPREVAMNRRKLYIIYHRAKRMNKRVSLKGDKLFLDGTQYTVQTLGLIQDDLHPRNFCEKSNENTLVFGGTLSEWHPFSNWFPLSLRYKGIIFPSLEHAYLHEMAVTFDDKNMASAILAAPDAEAAKRLSHMIKGIDFAKWDGMKKGIMEKLLGIKFAPDTELARELLSSGNKLLAETGKGKFYPCGLSITDKNILDTSKWSGNVLGKLLGKIRLALRG